MKLGFITCHFPPDSVGGGQIQSFRLCEALSVRHDVTVFSRAYNKMVPLKERTASFKYHRRRMIPLPLLRSLVDLVKVLIQVRSYRNNTKVFFSFHIQLASVMVVMSKHLFNTVAVVSPRGLEDFDFKGVKRNLHKYIYLNADIILIQSEGIRRSFIQKASEQYSHQQLNTLASKIRIFPNGINVPVNKPSKVSSRKNEIVFIGRLESIKGINYLLDAFRSCNHDLQLKIIGDGSQRSQLEAYAVGSNVMFLGMQTTEEILEHLNSAKALVLPSISENFPNVILEAFCTGIPVIGTNVGAIPELIEDGVNGYLVPPSDSMMLADKLNKLFLSEEQLDIMGSNAYQKAQQYDWKYLADKFDKILTEN